MHRKKRTDAPKKNNGIFTSICRSTASHNVYLTENSPKLKTVYPSPRWHLQVSISWFNPSPSPPPAYSLLTQMALTSIYMMVQLLRGTHHHPLHTPSHPDGTHRYLYYGSTPMWNPSPPPTYSLSPRGHLQVSIQGWASVLFKRTFHSFRSFPFFIKERSVLSVLFRSL